MAALTLEQFSAVCDEIAAISRAGLPLDRGLRDASAELPGRVKELAEEWSQRVEAGERLEALVLSRADAFPPAWRAVLEAGIRAGDLPQAVAAVARSARTVANLRHNIRVAWIYPYFLLATAYLMLWVLLQSLPTMWQFFRAIDLPLGNLERMLEWIAAHKLYWYPALGVILAIWIAWDYRRLSAQSELFDRRVGLRLLGSGWRAGRRLSQQASFCELLALLIEHGVPLAQALRLATEGSDAAGSAQAIEATCHLLEQGNTTALEQSPLPPLVKCVLLTGGTKQVLAERLRKLADYSRREADARVAWAAVRLPIFIAIFVGGLLMLAYVVMFWVPWLKVIHRLMEPTFR